MDVLKVDAQIRTLREVAELMEEIIGAYNLLSLGGRPYTQYDLNFFHDVETTMNTSVGPLAGKFAEFQAYARHRFDKGRHVIYQGGIADVTVDYGLGQGKAMQLKSTYLDDCATITNLISDAANQLTGERGEIPRAGDRLIVDVVIRSPTNPWPFSYKNTYGTKTLVEYKTEALGKVRTAIETYNPGVSGISNAQKTALTDVQQFTPSYGSAPGKTPAGPNSTQVHSYGTAHNGGQLSNNNHRSITVKVRYDFPYPLHLVGPVTAGQTHIKKVAFEVMRRGDNIVVYDPKVTLC